MLAVAPLFAGLVVAGPIAGFLLARFAPRVLVAAGLVTVGLGNLGVAMLAGPATGYVLFVLPLLLIGAGFVVATTVRTAIIFASVPRGPPGDRRGAERGVDRGRQPDRDRARHGDRGRCGPRRLRRLAPRGSPPTSPPPRGQRFADVLYAVGTPSFPVARRRHPTPGRRGLSRCLRRRRPHGAGAWRDRGRARRASSPGSDWAIATRSRPRAPIRWARSTSTATSGCRPSPEPRRHPRRTAVS